ncbi:MAG: lipoate--protein ligase [Clostridiales bacterium]|nr:lipoate--protein ligase [Clostridiales bacterium]
MNKLYESPSFDPTLNLAIEEALLLGHAKEPSIFLWQNTHTVVIGRGQNAWKECKVNKLVEDNGILVRRTTGGGAVYHDLGNLNFSFVMPEESYDVARQLHVIKKAVSYFGVQTELSGRNDIIIKDGRAKFSGNAFRKTKTSALHHGTILFDVDMQKLGLYLAPSTAKLKANGVDSVRSRVENLSHSAKGMNIPTLKKALFTAFEEEYGPGEKIDLTTVMQGQDILALQNKYKSWDWNFGQTPKFDISFTTRFHWGEVQLLLSFKRGLISHLVCFTDSNDPDLAQRMKPLLEGVPYKPKAILETASLVSSSEDSDIIHWLASQVF